MKDKSFDSIIHSLFSLIKKEDRPKRDSSPDECLFDEIITDYLHGRLLRKDRERVERHFVSCNVCRKVLITLAKVEKLERDDTEKLYDYLTPALTLNDKISSGIAVLADVLRVSLAWVMGELILKDTNSETPIAPPFKGGIEPLPIRGEKGRHCPPLPLFSKTVSGYNVILSIRMEEEKNCELHCNVTPSTPEKEEGVIKLNLLKDDRLLCSYPLINHRVSFGDITTGTYKIILQMGEQMITILSLDIEDDKDNDSK